MIFSELYSAYYTAVAKILEQIQNGVTDEKILRETVNKYAFSESSASILASLKKQKWLLVRSDKTTPICHTPAMPLTLLEKRWLKSVSLDPRVRLFDISFEGLEDIEPLFTPEDYYVFDKYSNGDDFTDEGYISRFKFIKYAIRKKMPITIETLNAKGKRITFHLMPKRLEYSEKDDKFRLYSSGCRYGGTVNLARVVSVKEYDGKRSFIDFPIRADEQCSVVLEITDYRNALERAMLHFAHFKKQAVRLDEKRYRLTVQYNKSDETELVIRVLSFGPHIEAVSPLSFRNLIIDRLKKQKELGIR